VDRTGPRTGHRILLVPAALAALALTLAGCSSSGGGGGSTQAGASPSSVSSGRPTSSDTASGTACDTPVPQVVTKVEPSVVTVRTPNGLGSGIVYRGDIVITDHHVVAQQEGSQPMFHQVRVSLADGSTTVGTVVGGDLSTDVAVVRTQRTNLPALRFSTALPRQGQTVLAVGSPLGLSNTVTEGIVSALGRDLPAGQGSRQSLVNLIQTDAAISPGNSGGALLDLCGNVVGVNEAYIPPKAGAVSIGFATPAAIAVDVANQILKTGTVTHPFLGVQVTTLTPRIQQALGVKADHGVVVLSVVAGGPATKAGVRRGDVITALGSTRIGSDADLLGALRTTKPGQTVDLHVSRGGKTTTLRITIGSQTGG
jgi:S1-C subfamily serine protease